VILPRAGDVSDGAARFGPREKRVPQVRNHLYHLREVRNRELVLP